MRRAWKSIMALSLAAVIAVGGMQLPNQKVWAEEMTSEAVSEETAEGNTEAALDEIDDATTEVSEATEATEATEITEATETTEEVSELEPSVAPEEAAVGAADASEYGFTVDFTYVNAAELYVGQKQQAVFHISGLDDSITEIHLIYTQGEEYKIVACSKLVDGTVLFEIPTTAVGTYCLKQLVLVRDGVPVSLDLEAAGIDASYSAVEGCSCDDFTITEQPRTLSDAGINLNTALNEPTAVKASGGKVVVVLDPGHDSVQPGAAGNGLKEEEINLKIALYCKEELEKYNNVVVYMTRTDGSCLDTSSNGACLRARCNYAASVNANLLVSIHVDAGSVTGTGAMAIVAKNGVYRDDLSTVTQASGQKILDELTKVGMSSRGLYIRMSDSTGAEYCYPNGATADWYAITRNCIKVGVPGIIVEHGFISNPSDVARFLNSDAKLQTLGIADATGIANYFGLTKGASASDVSDAMEDNSKDAYTDTTENISGFIANLYHSVLGRTPAKAEVSYWQRRVAEEKLTGTALVKRFLNSPEFKNKSYSNEEYVERMYEIFLGRASDPSGKAHWVGLLERGVTRDAVAERIGNSSEFESLCATYGMAQGSHAMEYVKLYPKIAEFVTDYYQGLLGRNPDAAGLEHWTGAIIRGEKSAADLSRGFVNSPEFKNRNLTKEEFVEGMYRTYLQRASDPSGKAHWMSKLSGMTQTQKVSVIRGFLNSDEYARHCENYGITVGSY